MKPIRTFSVIPSLPAPIEGLREVAYNLRWAWNHEAIELFRRLDRDLWETSGHNPVLMLGTIEQNKLEAAAQDDAFLAHLERVSSELESYLTSESTWFHKMCSHQAEKPLVAYFSAEFGLTECLSIFAGGLGILAGDHLKSASDLGVPLVGVGLLYQQGYFRQYLNQAGWQQEDYQDNDFHNLPLSPACDRDGKPLVIEVAFPGRQVKAQVWRAQVGRVPLYLLDTNFAGNARPEDRDITDQLYGGDREMRIRQEILLGIGGYRALEALGLEPTVYHMNEGHSAFLALERVRRLMETRRLSFAEARELASASLVFTTPHPGPGRSRLLLARADGPLLRGLRARVWASRAQEFLALGRRNPSDEGEFCMTVLALRLAAYSNGVSKLHGAGQPAHVAGALARRARVEEIPIGHVTNGVHFRSWISLRDEPALRPLPGAELARGARRTATSGTGSSTIPAEELWRTHERRRERLVALARRRVREPADPAQRAAGRDRGRRRGARPRRPDHRLCAPVRHLQARHPAAPRPRPARAHPQRRRRAPCSSSSPAKPTRATTPAKN